MITGIPALANAGAEAQQRLINAVDVLVDADVQTTFASHLDLDAFLAGTTERPDAFRLASRLHLLRC